MAAKTKIKIFRSTGTTAPTSLEFGELAWVDGVNKLYIGDNGGNIKLAGGDGAFIKLDAGTAPGVLPTGKHFYTTAGTELHAITQNATNSAVNNTTLVATTAYVKQAVSGGGSGLNFVGDVTGTGTTGTQVTLSIAANAVQLDDMAQMAANGFIANDNGNNQNPQHLSVADARVLLALDATATTPAHIANFDTQVQTSRLDEMALPTQSVDLNGQKITDLADPVDATDAANKGYVDSVAQGLDFKDSVRCATVTNIALTSATTTVDNITLVEGDRVLVKDQTTASENGIYVINASGGWDRSPDANAAGEISSGTFVYVDAGAVNERRAYVCTTTVTITPGVTANNWTQFSGSALPGGLGYLAVQDGGTGRQTLTTNSLLAGNGTAPVNFVSGSAGQVLTYTASGPAYTSTLDSSTLTIDAGDF